MMGRFRGNSEPIVFRFSRGIEKRGFPIGNSNGLHSYAGFQFSRYLPLAIREPE